MIWGLAIGCTLTASVLWPNVWVLWSTRRRVHNDLERVPIAQVGLVLGCAPRLTSGRENFYFAARMKAAAQLVEKGKVARLIVSGGPLRGAAGAHSADESEADWMKAALIELGISESIVDVDRLGFRTRLSVEGASKTSPLGLTIVSQGFHTPRAVYLAHRLDTMAHAFNAPSPRFWSRRHLKVELREVLSRTRAFWER